MPSDERSRPRDRKQPVLIVLHQERSSPGRVGQMLELVGLKGSENAYPHELSGGMRQRALLAIALGCGPKLLVADEPTTALDVTIQAQILELIVELQREFSAAVILITHDLGVVAEFCDRVAVMYAGRLVEEAPVNPLFARPRHRYTEALLRTMPAANAPGRKLPSIQGTVPAPKDRGAGCIFTPRCGFAVERCPRELPPLTEPPHRLRCWNPAS